MWQMLDFLFAMAGLTHTHTHTHIVTAQILFRVKTTVEVLPTSYLPTASNPLQLELIKLKRAVMF